MQTFIYEWVADVAKRLELTHARTLEVGSYDVNGTVAPIFFGPYWGVDMRPGPGVDQVADGEHLPFPDDAYEVVISTETLEHVRRPWVFVPELARVCEPGGVVILTTVGYAFPEHDVPADYWRFGNGALEILMADAGLELLELVWDVPEWSVCAAAKKP